MGAHQGKQRRYVVQDPAESFHFPAAALQAPDDFRDRSAFVRNNPLYEASSVRRPPTSSQERDDDECEDMDVPSHLLRQHETRHSHPMHEEDYRRTDHVDSLRDETFDGAGDRGRGSNVVTMTKTEYGDLVTSEKDDKAHHLPVPAPRSQMLASGEAAAVRYDGRVTIEVGWNEDSDCRGVDPSSGRRTQHMSVEKHHQPFNVESGVDANQSDCRSRIQNGNMIDRTLERGRSIPSSVRAAQHTLEGPVLVWSGNNGWDMQYLSIRDGVMSGRDIDVDLRGSDVDETSEEPEGRRLTLKLNTHADSQVLLKFESVEERRIWCRVLQSVAGNMKAKCDDQVTRACSSVQDTRNASEQRMAAGTLSKTPHLSDITKTRNGHVAFEEADSAGITEFKTSDTVSVVFGHEEVHEYDTDSKSSRRSYLKNETAKTNRASGVKKGLGYGLELEKWTSSHLTSRQSENDKTSSSFLLQGDKQTTVEQTDSLERRRSRRRTVETQTEGMRRAASDWSLADTAPRQVRSDRIRRAAVMFEELAVAELCRLLVEDTSPPMSERQRRAVEAMLAPEHSKHQPCRTSRSAAEAPEGPQDHKNHESKNSLNAGRGSHHRDVASSRRSVDAIVALAGDRISFGADPASDSDEHDDDDEDMLWLKVKARIAERRRRFQQLDELEGRRGDVALHLLPHCPSPAVMTILTSSAADLTHRQQVEEPDEDRPRCWTGRYIEQNQEQQVLKAVVNPLLLDQRLSAKNKVRDKLLQEHQHLQIQVEKQQQGLQETESKLESCRTKLTVHTTNERRRLEGVKSRQEVELGRVQSDLQSLTIRIEALDEEIRSLNQQLSHLSQDLPRQRFNPASLHIPGDRTDSFNSPTPVFNGIVTPTEDDEATSEHTHVRTPSSADGDDRNDGFSQIEYAESEDGSRYSEASTKTGFSSVRAALVSL